MLILLHGENSVASRDRLRQLEAVEINPNEPLPQESTLFADSKPFVLWQDKKLSVTQIKELEKKFGPITTEEFKVNPVVFKFLDALRPGQQRVFMPLWFDYLASEQIEVVFVMLVRQFRLMLDQSELPAWQAAKMRKQAQAFLKPAKIYLRLLEIDYQNKSGRSPVGLQTSLELLLLSL